MYVQMCVSVGFFLCVLLQWGSVKHSSAWVCVHGHWGGLCTRSWQSKQMYACHSLIRHICHCHNETVCLRKARRDFQRDMSNPVADICHLCFGIWQVYIQQEVTNMHYTFCNSSLVMRKGCKFLDLVHCHFSRLAALQTSHWFITSFDLACHEVQTLALCLGRQIIWALILWL